MKSIFVGKFMFLLELRDNKTHYRINLKEDLQSSLRHSSRGQDVIPWDLLAEIDFFVLNYSLTLS